MTPDASLKPMKHRDDLKGILGCYAMQNPTIAEPVKAET